MMDLSEPENGVWGDPANRMELLFFLLVFLTLTCILQIHHHKSNEKN